MTNKKKVKYKYIIDTKMDQKKDFKSFYSHFISSLLVVYVNDSTLDISIPRRVPIPFQCPRDDNTFIDSDGDVFV